MQDVYTLFVVMSIFIPAHNGKRVSAVNTIHPEGLPESWSLNLSSQTFDLHPHKLWLTAENRNLTVFDLLFFSLESCKGGLIEWESF